MLLESGQLRWMQREYSEVILPCAHSECTPWPKSSQPGSERRLIVRVGIVVVEVDRFVASAGLEVVRKVSILGTLGLQTA